MENFVNNSDIGQKLRSWRERKNLTQEELAEKSGVSERTIQRAEKGESFRSGTLKSLCAALGIHESYLFTGSASQREASSDITYDYELRNPYSHL